MGLFLVRSHRLRTAHLHISTKLSFVAAIFFLWLASDWPPHGLSEDYLYSSHMIQYLMTTFMVPSFLLISVFELSPAVSVWSKQQATKKTAASHGGWRVV